MNDKINELLERVEAFKPKAAAEIEDFRIRMLGKKGELTALMEEFKSVAPELKREFGQKLNNLKNRTQERINALRGQLADAAGDSSQRIPDMSRPGSAEELGSRHPISLVTNQIVDPRKLARLAALSRIAQVALCVDSPEHVSLLEAAARTAGVRMSVLVEIDVGSRRCGVPAGEEAVGLARLIAGSRHLAFAGLQAYHGAAQHLRSAVERREAIGKAIAACERTVEGLSRARIPCGIVSGAGTGTFELEAASGVYTELQAGSYCFMDGDYAANLRKMVSHSAPSGIPCSS